MGNMAVDDDYQWRNYTILEEKEYNIVVTVVDIRPVYHYVKRLPDLLPTREARLI